MKKILGLDLGTNSIGWALVHEAENKNELSDIIKLGVRVNPLTAEEKTDFEKGRPLSTNADRTLKRGARRNLQRFKLRRKNLIEILTTHRIIDTHTVLTELGNYTTHQTLALRAKAAKHKIEKDEFARVLLAINKKRGYKSSRKVKNEDEGIAIDGMAVAKELYNQQLTPGQYVYQLLKENKKYIPDFYQSDLQQEFDAIWEFQQQFYESILTDELYTKLKGQGQQNSRKLFLAIHQIYTAENKGKRNDVRLQQYAWRNEALTKQLSIAEVAYVLVAINNEINKSSGYLGAISDRSKSLYFKNVTVGENLYAQLQKDRHTSLKNQVFYRQDYLDEFEKIWETQAQFHSELTAELKKEVRDVIIFYQRKLKSQKHLISDCQFEKGHKAIPKSSPLFQEFKIWQNLNHLEFEHTQTNEKIKFTEFEDEVRQFVFEELNLRGTLKSKELKKLLQLKTPNYWKANFEEIEGNRTNEVLYNVYQRIAEIEGYGFDWSKKTAEEIHTELAIIFKEAGINSEILTFDTTIEGNNFDKQKSYQLWHLLYAAEDGKKITEADRLLYGDTNVALKKKLHETYGFKPHYASLLVNVSFQQDYGNLSSRAIRKIIPFLIDGHGFSEAARLAKYNHSHSLTAEEQENRILNEKLSLLKKNELRNPVVEKILNQMVNLVNQVIETYGKPDEVRVELSRELKKSAKERADMTKHINEATAKNQTIRKLLQKGFGIQHPTKSDIVKYKLYEELSLNGYKTLFTNTYIPKEKLFSKEIDIEHIIPKAILFDDSFSNKTLAYREVNLAKADATAVDFITNKHTSDLDSYIARVETLYHSKKISKGKYKKLLISRSELPEGFIERDLRNSQYIAKKATQMLKEVFRTVHSTSGRITDKLRKDWDLINVMKELNLPKYQALGLTEKQIRKNGNSVEIIKDWTKRNDHRHHAMDALTVAFTTHDHVQYLNNLNAIYGLKDEEIDHNKSNLKGIKNKITKVYVKDGNKKRKFIPPLKNFRTITKDHLEQILISFKNKNKVVTKNKNKTKTSQKGVLNEKVQLTPRGKLHMETVYSHTKKVIVAQEKVSSKFTIEKVQQVTKPTYREALLKRLATYDNDPKKAFAGKNSLSKHPIYLDETKTKLLPEIVKTQYFEDNYTIRKEINPDNFKDEKSLLKIIDLDVQNILKQRLQKHNGNVKLAFSELEKNPIWLNKEKGISIKRVRIDGIKNAEALHSKKDHLGQPILTKNGKSIAVDFVSTGNNHHVAIYKDQQGKLHDVVVSFYEAVARVNLGIPIIDKTLNENLGWKFLFTMKQNEMFVFPSENFNPKAIHLKEQKHNTIISKHLFRVQKFSFRDYVFRHHLETELIDKKELKEITFFRLKSLKIVDQIVKVRINHIGNIVHVGEY
ncbi:type II CRISPR RNA-guided endonuclease Cas9 [Kordia jejudonensis]|uniref:type II CRISPR RNA-guided endonuclease Cas9 n=1 Tax=Kordia jejudonensis TaxID=1348245 RepID=UPI000629146F|nr:type II CRISPR RNA-guided endonuclease Cas9 [Kordia jejudonensis]